MTQTPIQISTSIQTEISALKTAMATESKAIQAALNTLSGSLSKAETALAAIHGTQTQVHNIQLAMGNVSTGVNAALSALNTSLTTVESILGGDAKLVGYLQPPLPATTLTVDTPAQNATVSGKLTLTGTCGSLWQTIAAFDTTNNWNKVGADIHPTSGTYSISVDTTLCKNGTVDIEVMAFDVQSGVTPTNTVVIDLNLNISNSAPAPSPSPTPTTPAAIQGGNWTCVKNWDIGTDMGRVKVSKLFQDGWEPFKYWDGTQLVAGNRTGSNGLQGTAGAWGLETEWSIQGDTDSHIQYFGDYMDMIQIWHGGTPTYRSVPTDSGFGVITAPIITLNLDRLGFTPQSPFGYFQGEFRIGDGNGAIVDNHGYRLASNMWPAWWCIGWDPLKASTPWYTGSWGPEIDFFEFWSDTDKGAGIQSCTLHAPGPAQDSQQTSYCFSSAGTLESTGNFLPQQNIAPNVVGPPSWHGGYTATFNYTPGFSFGAGWHRVGCKINTDFTISIWTDDVLVGKFQANQFREDGGTTLVVPRLILNTQYGMGSWDGGADYGGIGNTTSTNHYRLGVRNIQIWKP